MKMMEVVVINCTGTRSINWRLGHMATTTMDVRPTAFHPQKNLLCSQSLLRSRIRSTRESEVAMRMRAGQRCLSLKMHPTNAGGCTLRFPQEHVQEATLWYRQVLDRI
jgi:hypothetical protein